MLLQYTDMDKERAETIASWTYEPPYSMYSMDSDEESIAELLNGEYFYVQDEEGALVGFICTGSSARVPGGYEAGIYDDQDAVDLGLGLKPELTGRGTGYGFLLSALQFIEKLHGEKALRLVVAAFNQRAINVYERAGFSKGISFKSKVNGQEVDFIEMRYTDSHEG